QLAARLPHGAHLLSPRGRVLENGMPRFFRRLSEGVFDKADVKFRAAELAKFIAGAAREHGLDSSKIVAVGYSNGANIAAAMMLLHPDVLSAAILFRAMPPLTPDTLPDLSARSVLLAGGERDQIARPDLTLSLASLLLAAGASLTFHWHKGGHELSPGDLRAAAEWLADNS
ncbi:MAG: alpha/beta hydrolase, partial [Bryobacteraceae bacterium]